MYVDGRMRPFVDSRKHEGQSLKDILNSSAVKNAVTSVTGGKAVTFENLQELGCM